jgi:3-oxoacyl-[acyl-carrier-protein] synthase II
MGIKSPAGCDLESFWATLQAGRSCAAPIRRIDASQLPVSFACEIPDFDPEPYLGYKEARRTDRVAQIGFAAAADALADAGELGADPARCGVVVGTGVGGLITQEEQEQELFSRGPSRVSPFLVPMMMANATAALVAMKLSWTGPNFCICTACTSGAHAVGEAARLVRDGSAEVVLAGGSEAASSSARAPPSSCWSAGTGPRAGEPGSGARSPATGATPTPTTSPRRRLGAWVPRPACSWPWPTPTSSLPR